MDKLTFTLDGRQVETTAGTTILEAAREHGVEIPTLCHDPRLKPYAGCRLCLVEIEKARGPLPACATHVTDGMVVKTTTDTINNLRRVCLDLLLSDHYGDCTAPCKLACPAGIDIQGFIALIAHGKYAEALKLIKDNNPLPAVCGRVCPRFCEQKCRRNLVDEPVAINALKRFVADVDLGGKSYVPEVKPSTGHRVAVVGGGPGGLSAAYYLAREGHAVTIFDANPALGGMLRYGIPQYRLPKELLDMEIATITSLCEAVRLESAIGRDFTLQSLQQEGYEVVFLALGAQSSQSMGVEGEEMNGVLHGIKFLRQVTMQKKTGLGRRVAVIGGGNTAMDAARTALRLGADEVTVVYRRSRDEMPANNEEIEQAEEEGIKFHYLAAPIKIDGANGRVDKMICIRMELGEPDASGRRRPEPVYGSDFELPVDTVIAAIGQTIDSSGINNGCGITFNKRGYVQVDGDIMATSMHGVFSGGDCATGPDTAVRAIGAGKKAADAIHSFLNNGRAIKPVKPFNCTKGDLEDLDPAEFADKEKLPRVKIPMMEPEERRTGFEEIEACISEEDARAESARCLSCGCLDVFDCRLRELATEYDVDGLRYSGEKHKLDVVDDHPNFTRDPNKCILCGSCLRICSEMQGIGALSFVKRGFNTVIKPSFGQPLQKTLCDSCGQCVSTCPTGALHIKGVQPKPGPWQLDRVDTVCPACGVGCNLEVGVKAGKVIESRSPKDSVVNEGNLCSKGTFNYNAFYSAERLRTPMIRRDGTLVPVDWEEAIEYTANRLRAIREEHGGESLALLATPELTNEEAYLAQKFARVALRTNNVGSTYQLPQNNALQRAFGYNASTCSFDDISRADLIFVFGTDIAQKYPVLALKIRNAVNDGARLAIVNKQPTRLDTLAQSTLKITPRVSLEFFKSIIDYIIRYRLYDEEFIRSRTIGFESLIKNVEGYPLERISATMLTKPQKVIEFTHLFIRASDPIIIVDGDSITNSETAWLANLALLTSNVGRPNSGIMMLRRSSNRQGQIDMGLNHELLPGQLSMTDPAAVRRFETAWKTELPRGKGASYAEISNAMNSGNMQGLVVLSDGDDIFTNELFKSEAFTVVMTPAITATLSKADVIFPATTYPETDGTVTNSERRVQRLNRAMPPLAGKETWRAISELGAAIGAEGMRYISAAEVFAEIASLAPMYAGMDFKKITRQGVQWPSAGKKGSKWLYTEGFGFEDGLARFGPSNVLSFAAKRQFSMSG